MQNNIDTGGLNTTIRARILYTILVGNLDINAVPDGEDPSNSAWNHINADDIDPDHPEDGGLLRELRAPNDVASDADRTKTRLRTMLASQYSFGVTVGAPVLFFCASFIYSLIDNYSNLGENDTSHALGKSAWISVQNTHSSLTGRSIWDVVDDDTSHCDHQWIASGWQQPQYPRRNSGQENAESAKTKMVYPRTCVRVTLPTGLDLAPR